MPNTLEQILGSQPNWRQQFADTSNQIIQDAKNVSLADYDRATGTYVPRSQRTNAPTFTQRDLTGAQTQPAQKQQDTTPQPLSYADMFVRMNPYRPQTAEEKEAERKRNRRNAVFAAIGDGISALSNLYFTTKGAPNAYTGGSTLTGKMYERQEQLRKERQALDQQYLNAYMNALRMDRQEAQQERNWKMQLENLAYNRAKYDNEQAYKRERDAKQDAKDERNYNLNVNKFNQQTRYQNGRLSRTGSGGGSSSSKLHTHPVGDKVVSIPTDRISEKSFIKKVGAEAGIDWYIRDRFGKEVRRKTYDEYDTEVRNSSKAKELMVKLAPDYGGTVEASKVTTKPEPPNYYGGTVIGNVNDGKNDDDFETMKRK